MKTSLNIILITALLITAPMGGPADRFPLVAALDAPSWYDAHTGAPKFA